MKIIHLSDIHAGKKVHGISMTEDQRHILSQILGIAAEHKPQAVLISGDIYDQPAPSAEAVALFSSFLEQLSELMSGYDGSIFIISGNHDSPERIAFGGGIMAKSRVYISPVYDGNIRPAMLKDEYGDIAFYMLPFVRPSDVRNALAGTVQKNEKATAAIGGTSEKPEESNAADGKNAAAGSLQEIKTYSAAVHAAIVRMNVQPECRNILLSHQFVTGAERCGSEDIVSVGGTDNVDSSVFAPFDYVALGHLHGPQNVGSKRIRYCGTPLKYSFSEKDHKKSVTLLDIRGKKQKYMPAQGEAAAVPAESEISITEIPLKPRHEMREIRGTYNELMKRDNYINTDREDFLHVILTDEEEIPCAANRMSLVYPNMMLLDYDNSRSRSRADFSAARDIKELKSVNPLEMLEDFYRQMNGTGMSGEQKKIASGVFDEISEEKREGNI